MNKNILIATLGLIVIVLGIVAYLNLSKEKGIEAQTFQAETPRSNPEEASATSNSAIQEAEPSIVVTGFKSEGPATITLAYENLPLNTTALFVCVPNGGCSEWGEPFVPVEKRGVYTMSAIKAFGPESTKGLTVGPYQIAVMGMDATGKPTEILRSEVFGD